MFIHRANTQYVFHTTWAWPAAWGPRAWRVVPCCNVLHWCHMYSPGGSSAGGLSSTPPVNKTACLPGLHTSLSEHHGITIHIACHFMSDLPFTLHATSCLSHHSHCMPVYVWFTFHIPCHFMSDLPCIFHATLFDLPFTFHATSCLINHSLYMPHHACFTIHITCYLMFALPFTLQATSCLIHKSHYMTLYVWSELRDVCCLDC